MSNEVELIGAIASDFIFDHAFRGENFYSVIMDVKRNSGKVDSIPLLVSERLVDVTKSLETVCVHIKGEFRSHNQHDENKSKLKLYVFTNSIELLEIEISNDLNDVFLEGHICKQPIYRRTPRGREIADVMLAVNRSYNKSDYIPCILWGRNAYYVRDLSAGSSLRVAGRVQSREYVKNDEIKTAYELSVNLLELC